MNNNFVKFDIYANRIGFFFNDKEKIGTYLGLFLTLVYILFSIIFFIIYIIHITKRKSLKVYESKVFSKELPNIEINPSLIYFAFGLKNPNSSNRFVDETIYYPEILFIDRNKINGDFNTSEEKQLEYEVCKKENFGKDYQDILSSEELNHSYCLKDFNLSLIGGYKYERMSNLRINLYPCVNTTENNNHCKPQETIDEYIKGGYFSILIKDIGLNPSNYSFPIVYTLQDLYTSIDKSIHRDLVIYYGVTEILTDTSLFQEKIKTEKYLQFRKDAKTFYFRDASEYYEGKHIISIDFILDDIIFVQKRTYTKVTDILSIIGGYMQLINTIFSLLSIFTNRLIPKLKILNGIFNFNFKDKKMSLKINTIKAFNTSVSKKPFIFPSNKQLYDINSKTPVTNNLYRNSLKLNKNSNNNLSKISLIGLENNENNNSSVSNVLNQRRRNSLIVIKEKDNEKSINSSFNISAANNQINERKNNLINKYNNKNANGNKNYIYRIGSFYPKLMEKKQNSINNDLKEYTDKLKFNIFDYYCFGRFTRKKKDIELYKSALSIYTKRMDIVNVFTLLLLAEKNCSQCEELF